MQIRLTGLTYAALGAGALLPGAAAAQTFDVTVAIPRLTVAEYHRPYVAMWIEKEGGGATTIAVWYDVGKAKGEGTKWLRDVRQWWRASGRSMKFPADGVSGATRAPGAHRLNFVGGRGGMPVLAPGKYTLVVEAAREVGGREMLRLPFAWNGSTFANARATGTAELGLVTLLIKR
ncbi:MAG: DUF2271 domain-containing protein [Pseudomonadota bacterium]